MAGIAEVGAHSLEGVGQLGESGSLGEVWCLERGDLFLIGVVEVIQMGALLERLGLLMEVGSLKGVGS